MSFYRGTGDVDSAAEAGKVLRSQNNLSDVSDVAEARDNLGLGGTVGASNIGFSPTGTVAATDVQAAIAEVAFDSLQKSSNLSDLGSVSTARANLGLTAAGGAALIGYTPTGTVAAGNVQAAIDEVVSDLAASGGSNLVGFIQSGTGAVATTVQSILRAMAKSPSSFGAAGDGVADDTAELQALIDAHSVIYLGDSSKTYKITAPLDLSAGNKTIIGDGATIDMRSIPSGSLWGIRAQGVGLLASKAITGATAGVYTVNCADTSAFNVDDYVQVSSADAYPYGGGSYNVAKGEIKRIRSIVANTSITFTTPLNDTYTATPVVYPITWCENITIKGVRILGSNTPGRGERGLVLNYVKNFLIEDCEFEGQDIYQVECASSIFGWIKRNRFRSAFYDGVTGTIFYGISVMDCSQWVEVSENVGQRVRHLAITTSRTSGQGFVGQPHYVNIHHNKMFDAMAGGAGRSFAYEQHGFGRFLTFDSNIADGCYAGFRLENAYDTVVTNNVVVNYGFQGIIIGSTNGDVIDNLLVANNVIANYTGEVASGLPCGIRIDATGAVSNLKIIGNVIKNAYNATAAVGTGITVGANTYVNTSIENNQIDAGGDATGYAMSTTAGANGVSFIGNRTYRFRGGLSLSSNSHVVKQNYVENDSAKATGFAYYSNGDRNIFQGNTARFIASAFRADTASTNNLFINNQAVQCTTGTFSNAGTGNTGRDNDVL